MHEADGDSLGFYSCTPARCVAEAVRPLDGTLHATSPMQAQAWNGRDPIAERSCCSACPPDGTCSQKGWR